MCLGLKFSGLNIFCVVLIPALYIHQVFLKFTYNAIQVVLKCYVLNFPLWLHAFWALILRIHLQSPFPSDFSLKIVKFALNAGQKHPVFVLGDVRSPAGSPLCLFFLLGLRLFLSKEKSALGAPRSVASLRIVAWKLPIFCPDLEFLQNSSTFDPKKFKPTLEILLTPSFSIHFCAFCSFKRWFCVREINSQWFFAQNLSYLFDILGPTGYLHLKATFCLSSTTKYVYGSFCPHSLTRTV